MWFFVKLFGFIAALSIAMTVYSELQWERQEYGDTVCLIRRSGGQIVETKFYFKNQLVRHHYEGAGFSTHFKLFKDGELVEYYVNE